MAASIPSSHQSSPLLSDLQALIGRLYDAHSGHDVRDYVVTDPVLLHELTAGDAGRAVEEKLIVMQADDGIDLALYLDAELLMRLESADPRTALSAANLGDFWTALEGVSHFNYLAWNAGFDKAVTLMELEMQAEVDKYVATRALLATQPEADLGAPLLTRLFEGSGLMADLSQAEEDRYRDASSLAGRYCRELQRRYPGAGLRSEFLRELRHFYRAPQPAKLARIRSLNES